MAVTYRLRSVLTNVSKNLFGSQARSKDVSIPSSVTTGNAHTSSKTESAKQAHHAGSKVEKIIQSVNTLHLQPYPSTTLKLALLCEGCQKKVVEALCKIKGVKKIHISIKKQKVVVWGHVDRERIMKAIKRTGTRAELLPNHGEITSM